MTFTSAESGRIKLYAQYIRLGADIQVCIWGGCAHLGATAIASARGVEVIASQPGHREGELASAMAKAIARALNNRVAVSAGIHYDAITREEIFEIERLANALAGEIIMALRNNSNTA